MNFTLAELAHDCMLDIGTPKFSEEDKVLFGQVMGIRSLISYAGTTAQELLEEGSHERLLEEKGRYYRLYTGQFQLS